MKILSLFDGMACGHIAFAGLGIPIERYVAYETDPYAIKTALHNFPEIMQCGDVFKADFAKYKDFDWLIGGSPCTYWSIAQSTEKRETTTSGLGWGLFLQYVRALHEAKPKYFVYENNYALPKNIRKAISKAFGFEPIMINSALLSAQNRKRLYWCGIRQADGSYSKANISQPNDRKILFSDVIKFSPADYKPVGKWVDGYYCGRKRRDLLKTTKCDKANTLTTKKIHTNQYYLSDDGTQYVTLTVEQCKILQTVPAYYDFPVSETVAHKLLGNGWTVEVIKHIIKSMTSV